MRLLIGFLFMAVIASAKAEVFTETPSPQPDSTPPTPSSSKFDSTLLGGSNPVLNDEEKMGVDVTNAWKDKAKVESQPGASGSVRFRFDESFPSIVCAVLQVTDIELQPGESVTHVNMGDTARWSVESASSGSGADQVAHLIVKPRDIGLATSLVVMTDRRTYHLLLRSDASDFFHRVTFLYEDTKPIVTSMTTSVPSPTPSPTVVPVIASPAKIRKASDGKQVAKQIDTTVTTPDDGADEDYIIKGKADWKPVHAYSKAGKTYLEMPESATHSESPVLFEERRGGLFHHDKVLVNYRVHGKWIVADRVIDQAVLVTGVGSGQEKVTIRHKEKTKTTPPSEDSGRRGQ